MNTIPATPAGQPRPSPAFDISAGLVVGALSGAFGVGGGIVLVPLLVLLRGVAQKTAQATSLVVVPIAAVSGAITYAIGGSVWWPAVGPLIAGGILGVLVGTYALVRTPDKWLSFAFALLLIVVAGRLVWLGVTGSETSDIADLSAGWIAAYLAAGLAMGIASSLLGVGAGIIVIPLLVTFFGFSQALAAGTSLTVMIPIALLGAWRLTSAGFTNWGQGARIGLPAAASAIGGASIALIADESYLQIGFALILVWAAVELVRKARK